MPRTLAASTALALVLSASGAQSAVTPEEVWESWKALSTAAGQELTVGSATRVGDRLEVAGVVVTYTDDLGSSFSAEIDRLSFSDNGDGTVAVSMSDSYPITLAFPADANGPSAVTLVVFQPGLEITAGGTATETAYSFDAPSVSVVLDEVKDQAGKVLDTRATMVMTGLTAEYLVARSAETTRLESRFAARWVALDIWNDSPAAMGGVTVSIADLKGETDGTFLGAEAMANLAVALNRGFTSDSQLSVGPMTLAADFAEATGQTRIGGQAAAGEFVLAIDKARVNYGTALEGASFTVAGPDIPFPQVSTAFAELAFNLLMPATKSETPQDFALLARLVDFTVSEDVWGLFDPTATLSRDPATFILDARGTGRWLAEIMDPAYRSASAEPPAELTSLDLTQLMLRAAGAELAARGALTFDNGDLVSFPGMPAPQGSVTVDIRGVHRLIDNLIALGLLPDDQATGARMMLGMFTRPGAGPDEVTSLIEFRDGGMFANGQPLQ